MKQSSGRTVRRQNNRSKSRTRNNSYKKPMTLNEAKEKVKLLRKQLSEVNEAHDRLAEEKEEKDWEKVVPNVTARFFVITSKVSPNPPFVALHEEVV